jgi:CRP-like cAMP-binding protein
VREGNPADSLHLIDSGRVAVRVSSPAGEHVTLNILSAGDYFGELSLVRRAGDRLRSATVVALEPTETLIVSVTAFEQLCRQQPGFEQLLVAALARRVEQLSGRLLDALYVSLDRRLCRCLLDLTRVYAEPDDGAEATIALTQDHLADLVGGTRPSVNQILQKLSADGIVEVRRGRVIVRDAAALRRLAAD